MIEAVDPGQGRGQGSGDAVDGRGGRDGLRAGHRFRGPAVVAQDDCTTIVLAGFGAEVDGHGNLILEVED